MRRNIVKAEEKAISRFDFFKDSFYDFAFSSQVGFSRCISSDSKLLARTRLELTSANTLFQEQGENVLALVVDSGCIIAFIILILSSIVVPWTRANYEAEQIERLIEVKLDSTSLYRLACVRLGCRCCSSKQLELYEEQSSEALGLAFDPVKKHEGSCKPRD